MTHLVTTPNSQFRRPNFVVGKGLLILEEESAMYLPLSLNENLCTLTIFSLIQVHKERSRYIKGLRTFWQEVIEEYEKVSKYIMKLLCKCNLLS